MQIKILYNLTQSKRLKSIKQLTTYADKDKGKGLLRNDMATMGINVENTQKLKKRPAM